MSRQAEIQLAENGSGVRGSAAQTKYSRAFHAVCGDIIIISRTE